MRLLVFALFVLLILMVPFVAAERGHLVLLAVMDNDGNYTGSAADLYLEIKPGYGRVFIESFPLTQLDTQSSTRFAKDVACKYAEVDCTKYDFFYTIRANSPIVGGPSAGAAVATLTVALLKKSSFDENVAISGTINSGGVIGPVGGLKEKIDAAHSRNVKKVVIPKGEIIAKRGGELVNLSGYGKTLGVEVVEVTDINEAVFEFTGKKYETEAYDVQVDKEYSETMKFLAQDLCNKSSRFGGDFRFSRINFTSRFISNEEEASKLMESGTLALEKNQYYSAASYCFGANVRYHYLSLVSSGLSKENITGLISSTRSQISNFSQSIPAYKTINDLQAYGAVIERLEDANTQINISEQQLERNNTDRALFALAFSMERLNSAQAWSRFFGKQGRKFDLSASAMEESCIRKLAEAEERVQYAQLFYPEFLNNTESTLTRAYQNQAEGKFELCLFKATRAKAEASTILDVISVDDRITDVIDRQLAIIKKNIVLQTEAGSFPIVSYSYFEYANTLKESDPYSAILYSELAAELSGLDLYFKSEESPQMVDFDDSQKNTLIVFVVGLSLGVLLVLALRKGDKPKRKILVLKRKR